MSETLTVTQPTIVDSPVETEFIDRRRNTPSAAAPARERRQFTNSYNELSSEAAELAQAVDAYKARNRRRFINYEEVLNVVKSLGYNRD